jgi:hypothetical protein
MSQSLRRYTLPVQPERQPLSISRQAADNLTFIRAAIERSSSFTAVPGLGGVLTGVVGLVAAAVAARASTADRWLGSWLAAAFVAVIVELVAMRLKAQRAEMTLTGANVRRFAVALGTPMLAGAALTYELWQVRDFIVMAPVWLLSYGAGLITGGMFSVRVLRAIGVSFMAVGIAAIATPPDWGNGWLALGFGGLHVGFGAYIARNHGG